MKEYIKIAWRNIWRNKRRTIITIASVFFAMFFALLMRSMQLGSYSHWTDGIVKAFTGFIQIHKSGYWEDRIVDNSFEYDTTLLQKLESIDNISGVIPRFESAGLASTHTNSKVALIEGIDPVREKMLSDPERNLIEGTYLTDSSKGILVSKRLADFLQLSVDSNLVIISQGYHGASAYGLFNVKGIVRLTNPDLDRRMIFMTLPECQELFGASGMITSMNITLHNTKKFVKTTNVINSFIDQDEYEVMDWKELNPEIVQAIAGDQASGYIILIVLYFIIGFGVLGTVLMMTVERRREFSVMVAVGMQKTKLVVILFIEMIMLGIVGIITGIAGSIPLILYFQMNPIQLTGDYIEIMESYGMEPIMPFELESGFYIGQSIIVLVIFFIAILYPLYTVIQTKIIKALKA